MRPKDEVSAHSKATGDTRDTRTTCCKTAAKLQFTLVYMFKNAPNINISHIGKCSFLKKGLIQKILPQYAVYNDPNQIRHTVIFGLMVEY